MNIKSRRYHIRAAFIIVAILMILTLMPLTAGASPAGITKAEFVAQLTDFFEWPEAGEYNDIWEDYALESGELNYTINDVELSDPYGRQIKAAYEQGIITLDAGNNFNPNLEITRGEAATIFASAWKLSGPDALVTLGVMSAGDPDAVMTAEEAELVFDALKAQVVAPVYALPRDTYKAPRRYIELFCATPGATIYFTNDGTEPTTSSYVYEEEYTRDGTGHIAEYSGSRGGDSPYVTYDRYATYKAFAVKDGMISSDIQTYNWHLYKPAAVETDFGSKQILEKTATCPAVYELWNDSESVRAMAWYIEGQDSGVLFDALQTSYDIQNLKTYIDANIATKPYVCVVGHSNGDHQAQVPNFISAGIPVYINARGWSGSRSLIPAEADQAAVLNIDEGDVLHLGGCDLYVYAMPGHCDNNIVLDDKVNGLVFASDIYGCTRAGSADNVAVSGLRADLLLSFAQQAHSNYLAGGGVVNMLFTGHDETPLNENNLDLFEAALQQVIDNGEAGCSPTLRTNDSPNSRTTIIGDMWTDNTDWISLKLAGRIGDATEYLTHNDQFNYNGASGYLQYSVLSNVVVTGGELVGTTVTWGNDYSFTWAGSAITVPRALPNKFDPWTYNYTIMVPKGADSITVKPYTMSTNVTSLKLNGEEVAYGSSNEVELSAGASFTIEVTAPDGVTMSTYTFNIANETAGSEIGASVDPTFVITIPTSVNFGTLIKNTGIQEQPFVVTMSDSVLGAGAHVDVNVFSTFLMTSGSATLGYDLFNEAGVQQSNGSTYTSFTADGSDTGKVTVDTAEITQAGAYSGTMLFNFTYVG